MMQKDIYSMMPIEPNQLTLEQERESMRQSVLSSVSHDLKTPLSCIIGALEIYNRTKDRLSVDQKDTLLATALSEAYRLDKFVTNILDMAKLESRTVKVKNEPFQIGELLEDCVSSCGSNFKSYDINLSSSTTTEPQFVISDPALLARAICIILDNAVKHGIKNPVISISYKRVGTRAAITIRDNGQGINEAKFAHIFSKYERFSTKDHKEAGTGLGLPICSEIMQLLGGHVSAANCADNSGAIFTLEFNA
mgnify:FL=1